MRILVHYHAYGDAKRAAKLVAEHSERLHGVIDRDEAEEVARITAEFEEAACKLAGLEAEAAELDHKIAKAGRKTDRVELERDKARIDKVMAKPLKDVAKRDMQIAEVRKQAGEDRQALRAVGQELVAMYADPAELVKHARLVDFAEIEENEHNLNIPRYVNTFEPEEVIDVNQVLAELTTAERARQHATQLLRKLLKEAGYAG